MYIYEILEALFYAVLIFAVCSRLPMCIPMAFFVYVALKKGYKKAWDLYQRTQKIILLDERLQEVEEQQVRVAEREIWAWETMDKQDKFQKVLSKREMAIKHAAPDALLCKICMENTLSCFLVPCKHVLYCDECAQQILDTSKRCISCRKDVWGLGKIYF